jgi:hypothetical protein
VDAQLLTPLGGLAIVAAAVPLAAARLRARRAERALARLGLPPQPRPPRARVVAAVALVALLAVAAAQPAVRVREPVRIRADAEVYAVVDVSRSMLARPAVGRPSRLDRARELAAALAGDLPEVRFGVATLTNRAVGVLVPTDDRVTVAAVLQRAVAADRPAPDSALGGSSNLMALTNTPQAFFSPATRRRVLVVLTDGETDQFAATDVATALRSAHVRLVLVRVGSDSERVFDRRGRPEPGYRPSPARRRETEALAAALPPGRLLGEDRQAIAGAVREALGDGRSVDSGERDRIVPLAPFAVLLAAAVLGLVLLRRDDG